MSHFPESYTQARNTILALTKAGGGWTHESFEHPEKARNGDAIHTDVFWRGPAEASRVLVITSGTHGVEGFCGSACQAQFVDELTTLPDDVAVLLIHAINPYGFEHIRRVTHENVDLNRNFIDFSAGRPKNETYGELSDLLNPKDMPDGKIAEIAAKLMALQENMGFLGFLKAVSGGQYDYPHGIQFGGQAPTWSRQTVEAIWDKYLAQAKIAVQIDLHTGLGPKGVGLLMMAANDDEPHKAITADWFGPMMVNERPASTEDVVLGGYLNGGMEERLGHAWVIPMTLEFGTEPGEVVLSSMIEDNWMRHHGDPESEQGRAIKSRVLRAFYPEESDWRDAVSARAREVFAKALAGLSTLTPDMKEG